MRIDATSGIGETSAAMCVQIGTLKARIIAALAASQPDCLMRAPELIGLLPELARIAMIEATAFRSMHNAPRDGSPIEIIDTAGNLFRCRYDPAMRIGARLRPGWRSVMSGSPQFVDPDDDTAGWRLSLACMTS